MQYKRSIFYSLLSGYLIFIAGCNSAHTSYEIDHKAMITPEHIRWEQDSTVLVLSGNCTSPSRQPLKLDKGKYVMSFIANGTLAGDKVLPHFIISLGADHVIKDMGIAAGENRYTFRFELPEKTEAPLEFTFDNDFADAIGDRNIFLYFPVSIKPY